MGCIISLEDPSVRTAVYQTGPVIRGVPAKSPGIDEEEPKVVKGKPGNLEKGMVKETSVSLGNYVCLIKIRLLKDPQLSFHRIDSITGLLGLWQ